jgi:hypothetical protein
MPAWALRFLPWILGAVAALGVLSVVNGWRKDAAKLPEVEQQFAVYRTGIETAARVRNEVSNEFQTELEGLRATARRQPAPAVRLCPSAPAGVSADRSAGRGDGTGAAGGQLPAGTGPDPREGAGPDIGRDLYQLADHADELTAQLRACQSYVGKLRAAQAQ